MSVKFSLKSSTVENVGTLVSVPHGSKAEIEIVDTPMSNMNFGLVERDQHPGERLEKLLLELGISGDHAKLEAFKDLVAAFKDRPPQSESDCKKVVKESRIFGLLGKAEPVIGLLSSAVTLYQSL